MIIGVTGHMGSGKNEVGKVLEQFGWQQVAFGDILKEMALAIDPIVDARQVTGELGEDAFDTLSEVVTKYGWEEAKKSPNIRRLLQRLGTEAGRELLGQDVWIRALQNKLARIRAQQPWGKGDVNFVVTDVRFPNEGEWIQGLGGTVWRVTRPGFEGDGHASETEVAKVRADLNIVNDGTLGDLWVQVVAAMPQ